MNRDLYITTYSAHATILEKLSKRLNAKIKKLYVSYGGRKAPKGSYDRKNFANLFSGYEASPSKITLHAKVILNDFGKNSSIWIWTGNLRKSTNSSQNLLLSLPISYKWKKYILDNWFNGLPKKHLVVNVGKDGISSVYTATILYDEMERCIKSLNEAKLKAYIFSPWGSSEFLSRLSVLGNITEINVYTRNALNSCWIDYRDKNEKIKKRFMAKELTPFPHSKCLFLTNDRDDVIWAYIGSANFTKTAMFQKNNVECAAFFKGSDACNLIQDKFNELKSKKLWNKHQCEKNGDYDDSRISYEDNLSYSEFDSKKGFERKNLIGDAEKYFSDKKIQKKLEKEYEKYKGGELQFDNFKFRITSIDDYYHLLVARKKKTDWVEVDVERKVKGALPRSILDVSNDITGLFNLLTWGKINNKEPNDTDGFEQDFLPPKKNKANEKKSDFMNIRFPIEKIMKDSKLKKEVCSQAEKLKNINKNNLSESSKKLLSYWLPLIERL